MFTDSLSYIISLGHFVKIKRWRMKNKELLFFVQPSRWNLKGQLIGLKILTITFIMASSMMRSEVFLDTSYVIALSSPKDNYHEKAVILAEQIETNVLTG